MDDHLSTEQVGWILDMIRDGEIEAARLVGGFRIPRAEAMRLGRERIEAEAGRKVSDGELERLIDEVIATNESA
jgi:hypothetical protein